MPNGLPRCAVPSGFIRSTLPASDVLLCASALLRVSPVVANRLGYLVNQRPPPLCVEPLGMPVRTGCGAPDSRPSTYRIRTMRLSLGVVRKKYTQRSWWNVGETAMPIRPPSPPSLWTSGTTPTTVAPPPRRTRSTRPLFRSPTSALPSGRKSTPQG